MTKAKKHNKTVTISVRLKSEEHEMLQRLCRLKNTTQTACLAHLATRQARDELLQHAVYEYVEGRASLSELATKTGLDVPTIMEAVAKTRAKDQGAQAAFLAAAKSLAEAHQDPAFYQLAVTALKD
jgi:hypothetical protein